MIIYFVFYGSYDEASQMEDANLPSFWRLWLRAGIYLMLFVFGVLFLHYKNLSHEFEIKLDDKKMVDVVENAKLTDPLILPENSDIMGAFENMPSLAQNPVQNPQINQQPQPKPQPKPQIGGRERQVMSSIFKYKPDLMTTEDFINSGV